MRNFLSLWSRAAISQSFLVLLFPQLLTVVNIWIDNSWRITRTTANYVSNWVFSLKTGKARTFAKHNKIVRIPIYDKINLQNVTKYHAYDSMSESICHSLYQHRQYSFNLSWCDVTSLISKNIIHNRLWRPGRTSLYNTPHLFNPPALSLPRRKIFLM